MKKRILSLVTVLVLCLTLAFTTSCGNDEKVIYVCASELPHADVLENAVAPILKEKGYTLKVTVIDWTIQNDAVANKDYDANYFQHVPYLELYTGAVKLFASAKVHYEPLGIYRGKATGELNEGKTKTVTKLKILFFIVKFSFCLFFLKLLNLILEYLERLK